MQVNLQSVSNIPRRLGFGFISDVLECIVQAACPPASPDFISELRELLGRQVLVTTTGGQVQGILASVQTDYIVVNMGSSITLIPINEIEGISELS